MIPDACRNPCEPWPIQIRGIHGSFVSSNIPWSTDEFVRIKHFQRHKLAPLPLQPPCRLRDNVAMCKGNSVSKRTLYKCARISSLFRGEGKKKKKREKKKNENQWKFVLEIKNARVSVWRICHVRIIKFYLCCFKNCFERNLFRFENDFVVVILFFFFFLEALRMYGD